MPACEKCGKEFSEPRWLEVHHNATHAQSLTDDDGHCKMCGEPVDRPARHLRQVCEPPR
jgi:RNA polymerase-binding transcription factor DksA